MGQRQDRTEEVGFARTSGEKSCDRIVRSPRCKARPDRASEWLANGAFDVRRCHADRAPDLSVGIHGQSLGVRWTGGSSAGFERSAGAGFRDQRSGCRSAMAGGHNDDGSASRSGIRSSPQLPSK